MTRSEMDRLNRLAAALRRSLSARISARRGSRPASLDDRATGPGGLLLLLCASPTVLQTNTPQSPAARRLRILVCPLALAHTQTSGASAPTKTARMGQVDREERHRISPQWAIYVDVIQTRKEDGTSALGGRGFGFVGGAVLGDVASASFQGRYSYSDRGPQISQTEAILGGSGATARNPVR